MMDIFQRLVWQQLNGERDNGFWKGRFMPDKFDYASELTEREREESIERARRETPRKLGPVECWRCYEYNTRRHQGYAICADCFEALNGTRS